MTIFRGFRRLLDVLDGIASELSRLTLAQEELAKIQREGGSALDRVNALEMSRHQFRAEIEGMLLRAEGKLKAASNAEARERHQRESYEKHLLDPLDPNGEESAEAGGGAVLPHDALPSEAEGLQAVRLALAPSNKAAAVSAKWGR